MHRPSTRMARTQSGAIELKPRGNAAFSQRLLEGDLTRERLSPLDLGDLVRLGAAGRHDFHGRALLLADQRAGQRRGDGDAALLGIRLRLTDDLLALQGSVRLLCRGRVPGRALPALLALALVAPLTIASLLGVGSTLYLYGRKG